MKNNIEENIKMYEELKRGRPIIASIEPDFFFNFVDSILADRERLEKENKKQKEDIQRMQELLDKSDANNTELQKEIETLKNDTYWKGYKYDVLVEKMEKVFKNRRMKVLQENKNPEQDILLNTLQELLEEEEV